METVNENEREFSQKRDKFYYVPQQDFHSR